jgi:hypothetical protein
MAKAAGAYTKFENPDQFRAIDANDGTRPDLLLVGIQEQQIHGDVLITKATHSPGAKLRRKDPLQPEEKCPEIKVWRASITRRSGVSSVCVRVLWSLGEAFQEFFAAKMKHAEEYRGIPGEDLSTYWCRRISATLRKTIAEGILARVGRLGSGPYRDESSWKEIFSHKRINVR